MGSRMKHDECVGAAINSVVREGLSEDVAFDQRILKSILFSGSASLLNLIILKSSPLFYASVVQYFVLLSNILLHKNSIAISLLLHLFISSPVNGHLDYLQGFCYYNSKI